MADPVVDGLLDWKPDADTADTNLPQEGTFMTSGGPGELSGELRRIKSEIRALSIDLGWDRYGDLTGTLAYVSGNSFTLTGDQTAVALRGRRIRATLGSGYVYGNVQSATYSGGTGLTTVSLFMDGAKQATSLTGSILDATLTEIAFGSMEPAPGKLVGISCRLGANAPFAALSTTPTALSWVIDANEPQYDLGGMFDAGAPTRITLPYYGRYMIGGQVAFHNNSGSTTWGCKIQIRSNGTTVVAETKLMVIPGHTIDNLVSLPKVLLAASYLELLVSSGGATDVVIDTSETITAPNFWAILI